MVVVDDDNLIDSLVRDLLCKFFLGASQFSHHNTTAISYSISSTCPPLSHYSGSFVSLS
jgi:hypothetical protein